METIKELRILLENETISRTEILEYVGKIEIAYKRKSKLATDIADELTKTNRLLDERNQELYDMETSMIKGDNLLEHQLVEEFEIRLKGLRNGQININNVLKNFKLL